MVGVGKIKSRGISALEVFRFAMTKDLLDMPVQGEKWYLCSSGTSGIR